MLVSSRLIFYSIFIFRSILGSINSKSIIVVLQDRTNFLWCWLLSNFLSGLLLTNRKRKLRRRCNKENKKPLWFHIFWITNNIITAEPCSCCVTQVTHTATTCTFRAGQPMDRNCTLHQCVRDFYKRSRGWNNFFCFEDNINIFKWNWKAAVDLKSKKPQVAVSCLRRNPYCINWILYFNDLSFC